MSRLPRRHDVVHAFEIVESNSMMIESYMYSDALWVKNFNKELEVSNKMIVFTKPNYCSGVQLLHSGRL